jgi:hypothetical protein
VNHLIQFKESNKRNCKLTQEPTYGQTTNEIQPSSTSNHNIEGMKDENVFSNHNKQTSRVSFLDQPGINKEINDPIATNFHSPNYLYSSGFCYSTNNEVLKQHDMVCSKTTLKNQITHLRLASHQQSFSASACVPSSTICSFQYRLSSTMVQLFVVKVPVSSTKKVSHHAFASLAFEPVTSTNSSAKVALKAIAEVQASADSNTHFSLARAELKAIAKMQASANSHMKCNSFLMVANENEHMQKETASIYRLVVKFKQRNESKLQLDLIDPLMSDAIIRNANLDTKNNFQQSTMPSFTFQMIVAYLHNLNFDRVQAPPDHFNDSKISLHFFQDYKICCDGEWKK